jgi:hypothetical protein
MRGGFVNLEKEEPVEVDLSGEQMEIVSTQADTTFTKTTEETREEQRIAYGGLDESLWAGRQAIEQHWIAAKPEQRHMDLKSPALSHPQRTVLIGTNGLKSFAFCTVDVMGTQVKPLPMFKEGTNKSDIIQELATWSSEYGEQNPAFRFKLECAKLERLAFVQMSRFEIDSLADQTSAMLKTQEFRAIQKTDPSLVPAMKHLGPLLSNKLRTLPKTNQTSSIKSAPRPGNAYSELEAGTVQLIIDPEPITMDATVFHLTACPTPTEEKQVGWKETRVKFACQRGSVPSGACNDTHVAVLYQPAAYNACCIELLEIAKGYKCTHKAYVEFPADFQRRGMLSISLSIEGIVTVSFSCGVLLWDPFGTDTELHAFRLSDTEHPRMVMCSRVRGEWLLLGTDKGECYQLAWRSGIIQTIAHVPAVEPLFSVDLYNGAIYMHTVMSVVMSREDMQVPLILNTPRPLSVSICGSLIYVPNKYGGFQIFKTDARNIVYQAAQIPQPGEWINGTQHTYGAVKAYPEHVVCLYPNGVVRNYKLIV